MNQFTIADRKRMEFLLSVKMPVRQIAEDLGRPKSSVLREIIARAVVCERHYGSSNRLCANFESCFRRVVFTSRIDRRAALYDLSDPDNPKLLDSWQFSGNPDIAAFCQGRVIIPCGL